MIVALAVWRIVVVVRDAGRLDAPIQAGVLRWCRSLAIGLMAVGIAVFLLQLFVGSQLQLYKTALTSYALPFNDAVRGSGNDRSAMAASVEANSTFEDGLWDDEAPVPDTSIDVNRLLNGIEHIDTPTQAVAANDATFNARRIA